MVRLPPAVGTLGDRVLELAFVQAPTARQREDAAAARERGEYQPFLHDLSAVRAELARRGVPVCLTYCNETLPSLRGLRPDQVFAFGGLATMWRWLERFGWQGRLAPSYPRALDPFLHRRCWRGTPAQLLAGPARAVRPVFVKTCRPCFPDGERLDAQVWPTLAPLADIHPSLTQACFLASEAVGFVSEYRCYVMAGRLLGVHAYQLLGHYCGPVDGSELEEVMPGIRPDPALVAEAIAALGRSGTAPTAYALDFGLVAHGRMSLVELNDAVALTNYGLGVGDYLDLHLARWRELAAIGAI